MYTGYITDVEGIAVGHEEDESKGTGVTVVLPPEGNTAGVDVRGGGPGTRECILLHPTYAVDEVHAFVLSGGSAYGLEAASGVMRGLREDRIGFDVGVGVVPIVPSAVLFDLTYKDANAWPDQAMGLKAYEKASRDERRQGSVGAGCGATVAKSMGVFYAKKSGIGSASIEVDGVTFAAIVALNAFGNIVDDERGRFIAEPVVDGRAVSVDEALSKGVVDFQRGKHQNTTLAVVATDATLTKTQLCKLASISHNGYARSIVPVHTELDGDTIFAVATNRKRCEMQLAEYYMPKVVARAVANAVYSV
ncbi:MAG: P1 family peptidase [Peptoniphilus sp.]|nr:P1 family peptidase [Peptoniphilus sp.]MDD7363035.1 P1 family peptidase [Bacillota bacterium]MDY6045300.1 P1 family peptidase [Peptoniphilus sp.]